MPPLNCPPSSKSFLKEQNNIHVIYLNINKSATSQHSIWYCEQLSGQHPDLSPFSEFWDSMGWQSMRMKTD
jgi:hypothetical protein